MNSSSHFFDIAHPFVWTSGADRTEVLSNVNEPIWHRFLEEAESYFEHSGGVRSASFPLNCHRGNLDEVMAACVLAYVRDDTKYWSWIADWLRGVLSHFRTVIPLWREQRYQIVMGGRPEGCPENVRQFFQALSMGKSYWVEGGFNSVLMHLLDQLEAYAPDVLSSDEKYGLLDAVSDYAERYAYHEEKNRYNNRAMWANAAILLAGIAHSDPRTSQLLRIQAARRNQELRTTYLDDGFHVEGSPDYHLMATDALLAYLLPVSHLTPDVDVFACDNGDNPFGRHPSFVQSVKAYLHTVLPGPTPWNQPRGCSVSTPVTVRPALVQAWRLSRDPGIGWLLNARMGVVDEMVNPTPLKVSNVALLGLGHYQPLMNFWLYRPVEDVHLPKSTYFNMADYGSVSSRSGWDDKASCVTTRYGYEGTGKGHRDHAHISLTVGGINVLKDPFPRFGPKGLETAMYHNTVVLDESEPAAVVGLVQDEFRGDGIDAFMIVNSGGHEPERLFLGDPCEETNCWYTNHPQKPDFKFQRVVIHLYNKGLILVDAIQCTTSRCIDWFFHSDLMTVAYDNNAAVRTSTYQSRQRAVPISPTPIDMSFRGETEKAIAGQWLRHEMQEPSLKPHWQGLCLDAPLVLDRGHYCHKENRSIGGGSYVGENDYYLRARVKATQAQVVWAVTWGASPVSISADKYGDVIDLKVSSEQQRCVFSIDFRKGSIVKKH